jgi:ammonia channel protein AmtB
MEEHLLQPDGMRFDRHIVDIDGGIGDPIIATAIGVWAIVLGVLMFVAMRSTRKCMEKILILGVIFACGFFGTVLVGNMGQSIVRTLYSNDSVSIGFIGAPPRFLAPTVALVVASLAQACIVLWKWSRRRMM